MTARCKPCCCGAGHLFGPEFHGCRTSELREMEDLAVVAYLLLPPSDRDARLA